MTERRRQPLTLAVGWLLGSPLAIAAVLSGIAGITVLARAGAALATAGVIRSGLEAAAARVAADIAAHRFVASGGAGADDRIDAGGGIVVTTHVERRAEGEHRVTASVGAQRRAFVFTEFAGGTPPALVRPLSTAVGAQLPARWTSAVTLDLAEFPALDERSGVAATGAVTADIGIDLLRLAAGTDRDDFVLSPELAAATSAGGRLCAVPGNLWVDAGAEPLAIELAGDLTLLVQGNVYLGRSVHVTGRGLLTIVARGDGGVGFVDADGNGRWSPGDELRGSERFGGPMEGAGNVYLGLPREGADRLDFDLGLCVAGVLHVGAELAAVHGPVVLEHGGVPLPGRSGALLATGRRLPSLRGAALPGFVPVGSPRPGPLAALGGEPLYAAGPAR